MHIERLAITACPAHGRRHDDECVLGDEIPYASLLGRRFVAGVGLNVEFQGRDKGQEEGEEKLEGEEHVDECRQVAVAFWSCEGYAGGMRLE